MLMLGLKGSIGSIAVGFCQEEISSESLLLHHYENHMRHVAGDGF